MDLRKTWNLDVGRTFMVACYDQKQNNHRN
jgi:hypothetical protein